MIVIPPIPTWKELFALFASGISEDRQIAEPWLRTGDIPFLLSKSAWSLWAISQWFSVWKGTCSPLIWIPDYFCNQSLAPLRGGSARLHFYPVRDDLLPDWEVCRSEAEIAPPDIFVLVHYFGIPSDARKAREFCGRTGAALVEDAAHLLLPVSGVGEQGDFVLYSPHKQLPVPEGAVLVMRPSATSFKGADPERAESLMKGVLSGLTGGNRFPRSFVLKRALQKLIPQCVASKLCRNELGDFDHDADDSAPTGLPLMNKASRRMLFSCSRQLPVSAVKRRMHGAVLNYLVRRFAGIAALPGATGVAIPYLFVMRAENAAVCRERCRDLRALGLPAQSWPDLPPEVRSNPLGHEAALRLRETILTLPVHQCLPLKWVIRALASLEPRDGEAASPRCRLVPFSGDRAEWDVLLREAGRSNLLQSWQYGQAKSDHQGWKTQRFVVFWDDQPIACFQALSKGFSNFGRVVRINRGPLWLQSSPEFSQVAEVFRLLRSRWSLKHGKLLLIAPELAWSPETLELIIQNGFSPRNIFGFQSSWLDLRQSPETLRKQLQGKWRNQLVTAEKCGLSMEICETGEAFDWVIARYRGSMKQKGFAGAPVGILESLWRQRYCGGELVIMRANLENDPLSAVIVARHGIACTYLIGWNSDRGRRTNSNNFLLWNAVLEMRRRGCVWFDLGGMDDIATPDISRFKRNMNGELYQLVGEFS